jgi:tetratricopeptide (TPR) repeat protein
LIKGLWDIFNYGLAYYERHGKSMAGTKGELINMFHFLNKTLNPDSLQQDFETVKSKINMGRHPKAHHSYVRIGSYMAEVLVEQYGTERLDGYHKNGAFPFFADYIKLTKGSKDSSFLINEAMKKKILDYNTDWKESWNNATRELWFAPFEDIDRQLEMLASHAKNKKIYPDFTTQIFTAIWKGALISSPDKYIPAAKKFTALYPESAKPQLLLGNLYVLQKKFEEAQQAFELAMRAQVDRHVMAPSRLNYYATDLFQRNYLDEALIYVKVASTFYPGEGIWDDTRGDIYMEKSRRAFRQALDNDPTLEDSWKQLKKIE